MPCNQSSDYEYLEHMYKLLKDSYKDCIVNQAIIDAEDEKVGAPMLWIGLYVALASLVCSLAMAADVVRGFRHRKLWFPCKFFTLNAASLTLLSVAMKLPLDLTTPMSQRGDQLAKLSSTVFMCTAMGNFMPSLGSMGSKELLMNVAALDILVITMAVNVSIQFYTGVISGLMVADALVLCFMLVLLAILTFSALIVEACKKILELKYGEKQTMASNEECEETEKLAGEKLKENVKKYWMIAESGGPQFVMASSPTCSAAGAICLLTALILIIAHIAPYTAPMDPKWNVASSYRGSITLILIIQSSGVIVGTIAPAFRWLTAISFKRSKEGSNIYRISSKIEYYWIQSLVEWKERPLGLQIRNRRFRKLVQDTKNLILCICIRVQIVIVVASKAVCLIPICFTRMAKSCSCCNPSKSKPSSNHEGAESKISEELDLSRYVLQLEGEEELPKNILINISKSVNQFIQEAKKKHPKNLMKLLEKSADFKGVAEFDSDQVPRLHSDEPPNCWSLSVATLASIAIALPEIKNNIVDRLLCSVSEGFLYTRIIEKSLDTKGDLVNIRNAAEVLWLGVELYGKWLDEDLQKMVLKGKPPKENLQTLSQIAKSSVIEFMRNVDGSPKENPLNWPVKVIADNSMYRISQTILLDYHGSNDQTYEELFEQLSVMIADILGACLTNLPRLITMKCSCSAIEKREESVQEAARLFGETEEILKILQQRELPSLDHDQAAYIDEWRAILKPRIPQASISTSNNESISSGSGELHIDVE